MSGDIWFEVKVPNRCATKQSSVDDRAPHNRAKDQVQRAQGGRVNNDQDEDRNHEMTRPIFLGRESIGDKRHENSDDGNDRRGDVQPFASRDSLTAHDVWTDVEDREQDRQVRADRC